MSNSNSSKQILLSVIGIAILVIAVVGVAFAFFNYTRTGSGNAIRVGRISFVSKNEQTITLNNLFPIDPSNTSDMNDDTKVGTYSLTIEGDTDYAGGIEYLVSTVNSNISTLPISINMTVGSGLGTNDTNYFTTRDTATTPIYKKIIGNEIVGDQMLLVGFIPQNTILGTSDETGDTITIKAYLDKNKILISDTYDGTESDNMGTPNSLAEGKTVLTTEEWNALQSSGVSFQIKVEANEGIWVNGSLEEIMKKESLGVDTEQGVDFSKTSDQDGLNGEGTKGVYMRAGTENDAYPIVYYRGAVEDNNVLFNNKCWKAVRTTDTGGVKLIYNGESQAITTYEHNDLISDSNMTYTNDSAYPYTYDGTAKTWTSTMKTDNATGTITFSVNEASNYSINYEVSSETGYDKAKFSKNGTLLKEDSGTKSGVIDLGQLTTTDVIKVEYTKDDYANSSAVNDNVIFSVVKQYGNQTQTISCANTGTDTHISLSGTNSFAFNAVKNSPAYVGYMWGTVYPYSYSNWTSNAKFGSGFTWDGTNYKLTDATETTPNDTHHYSCNSTDAEATCTSIRYVYWVNGSSKYYITISEGKGIEEAIKDMQTNTNPSNAKTQIDAWYLSNMNNVTNRLEDTIWCNDRSIERYNGWSATGTINGSGDYENYSLLFGAHERSNYASGTSTTKNQPSLACANKNDAFTVNNGNGNQKLQYPVALLTEDEIVLAGGLARTQNTSFYLYNGSTYYWSLSPSIFLSDYPYVVAGEFPVYSGYIGHSTVNYSYGLRPAVSLKPGTPVVSGTGTVANPYVIE